ncbi:hypothetical protein NCAS_0I02460 [Naumovozyma castellii]|uniref:Vps72/YL1 C-terminal domain-containing protein n=1 Tax=Naumovozyma castellii TaxID=27288 RepID=G0VK80_NAUCA|nr:hypothetical protein NCAS_0I02460 [Naumovozyma castellii CBS 4309]CCC71914.1 hypothetical protein NCAS_0I02460 [Naumovozyma castellii CBS 4309]
MTITTQQNRSIATEMSSPSSLPSSDDDEGQEFLINTRERRQNAGNKLKKLLEQELQEMQSTTQQLDEDEIDLLFQEDEEDEEFEVEENSEEDGEQLEDVEEEEQEEKSPHLKIRADEDDNDQDLMLSESGGEDQSNDDEADDAGERELQRQERLKRKRKQQKQKGPVILRKRKPSVTTKDEETPVTKRKHSYDDINAGSLLQTDRRTSKRSSVVANKLQVYEKLSKAEEKRKMIRQRMQKHKKYQSEHVLTQEDRMRIALETEKFNIQSLDKYKEQELSKKQNRLAMQQRQKMKFKQHELILRDLSTTWLVTPLMEIEDARYWSTQLSKREKKKRKYPKRQSKKQENVEVNKSTTITDAAKLGGEEQNAMENKQETTALTSVPTDLQQQSEIKNISSAHTTEMTDQIDKPTNALDEHDEPTMTDNVSQSLKDSTTGGDIPTLTASVLNDDKTTSVPEQEILTSTANTTELPKEDEPPSKTNLSIKEQAPDTDAVVNQKPDSPNPASSNSTEPEISLKKTINAPVAVGDSNGVTVKEPIIKTESLQEEVITKQVSFVANPEITIIDPNDTPLTVSASKEVTPALSETPNLSDTTNTIDDVEEDNEELIYEGPNQMVSKDFVILYRCGDGTYNRDVHADLFGPDWSLASHQRSLDVETIFKSSSLNEKNDLIEGENENLLIKEVDLSVLDNFPSFGEYDKKVIHHIDSNDDKNRELKLKTASPTGVYLPCGLRKKCLITNKNSQYFDPKNGIPYSDLEAYKIIQELQDPNGSFKWFGFKNGGIFLNVKQKPANGVPEGF